MQAAKNPAWAEAIQLVPILVLAFPFVLRGEVDITRAASGFLFGALIAIPIIAGVLARGQTLNPILVGTDLWLLFGAIAFNVPVPPFAAWLGEMQGFGLFATALAVGVVATLVSPQGFIGARHSDPRWIRRASLILLGFAVVTAIWAFSFRHDVRLGGGLPFIVLNVVRRVLIVRAPAA